MSLSKSFCGGWTQGFGGICEKTLDGFQTSESNLRKTCVAACSESCAKAPASLFSNNFLHWKSPLATNRHTIEVTAKKLDLRLCCCAITVTKLSSVCFTRSIAPLHHAKPNTATTRRRQKKLWVQVSSSPSTVLKTYLSRLAPNNRRLTWQRAH